MNINKEHQLIRIQLLANANFGSASGAVTLDRPTQLDAYYEMPFIPNSSLRGSCGQFANITKIHIATKLLEFLTQITRANGFRICRGNW